MIRDYFRFAFANFKARKVRTYLTMIGIFIGVAAVVSLISVGQGLQSAMSEAFKSMGTDKIFISPKAGYGLPVSGITELTDKDKEAVEKTNGVERSSSFIYKLLRARHKEEVNYVWVTGLPVDRESLDLIETIQLFKMTDGRGLKQGDKYKAVAGSMYAEGDVFDKKISVRDKIEIEGREFSVIGIMAPLGNPQDDSQLLIPMEAAREIFGEKDKVDTIIVQAKPGFDVEQVAEKIKENLRDHRNLKEGEEDFTLQTSAQLIASFGAVFTVITIVLIGIAAISLFVGGVGIMNTMYTSVLERTNEIGIMKAIGAKNSNILLIFLIESGMLGLIGGAVGIALGVSLGKLVQFAAAQANLSLLKASFPWYLIIGALLFSFIAGVLSGILPARAASGLKPVDALRYE